MNLPIHGHKEEILRAVRENQVTIVVGETGSGKTTYLPQLLFEAGYSENGIIGVTEPRRIAVTSTSRFVAVQLGEEYGKGVGYQIRFDDYTNPLTKIKFMTDGILLREFQTGPDLNAYSVIMVDEAHERNINIDFTLGLLKDLLDRRPDLRVIVASATIDAEKFSNFFGGAPVINVSGRMYPVEIIWGEYPSMYNIAGDVAKVVKNIYDVSQQAYPDEGGDILVFLPGEEEIFKVKKELEEINVPGVILPLYGLQSPEKQQEIFADHGRRKIILATNIAETSITIDGVVYVVDTGLIRQMNYNQRTGISCLDTVEHSRAGCDQRAGRAGRTRPGVCYRMFTKENYEARPAFTEPEIKRSSLAGIVLAMEDIGIEDIMGFDFIDHPGKEAFNEAYQMLTILGAITKGKAGLTEIGVAMAKLPLDPHISRMFLEAIDYGCVREVAIVAAFLSVKNVFVLPRDKKNDAIWKHNFFKVPGSDARTFLKVWDHFIEVSESGFEESRNWCFENFLNHKSLREIGNILEQLFRILRRNRVEITSCNDEDQVNKAVVAGLLHNLSQHSNRGYFQSEFRNIPGFRIHPGSALFRENVRFIVTTEVIETSNCWGVNCVEVDPAWLPELLPDLSHYGESKVIAYDEITGEAEIQRSINYKDMEVGFVRQKVNGEEAKIIQDRVVAEAERKGLTLLSFRKLVDDGIFSIYTANEIRNCKPFSTTHGIVEGAQYYCELESWLGETRASLKFRVFDLRARQTESTVPSEASIQMLLNRFRK